MGRVRENIDKKIKIPIVCKFNKVTEMENKIGTMKRFFKRLKNRIKACFRFRDMWTWNYESCERCGSCLRIAYTIQDEIWYIVYGSDKGCLCLNCFLELASEKNVTITPDHFKWLCLFNGDKPSFDIIQDENDSRK